MNANYFRKLISDEMGETLMWSGLAAEYRGMKSKEVDNKGKSYYRHANTGYYFFNTR